MLRQQIERAFHDAHLQPPTPVVESVSHLTNRRLMEDADLLAVLPWLVAHRDAKLGRVAILPVALPSTVDPIGIATRLSARLSPAAEMLIKELRAVAREIRAKLAPEVVFHPAMAD
jgi:DNA-binding transcriptional LysR family regulator